MKPFMSVEPTLLRSCKFEVDKPEYDPPCKKLRVRIPGSGVPEVF